MKKMRAALLCSAIAVTAAVVGGTLASYQAETSTDKTVSASKVGISIEQTPGEGADPMDAAEGGYIYSAAPGSVIENEVRIKSSGGSEPVYVRVTVTKSWYDSAGEKVWERDGREIDAHRIELETDETSDWIIKEDPDSYGEVVYFYYKKPIGERQMETADLLDRFTVLGGGDSGGNLYTDLAVGLTFEAEAVQQTAAASAMESEWGMTPVFAGDGVTLTGIEDDLGPADAQ